MRFTGLSMLYRSAHDCVKMPVACYYYYYSDSSCRHHRNLRAHPLPTSQDLPFCGWSDFPGPAPSLASGACRYFPRGSLAPSLGTPHRSRLCSRAHTRIRIRCQWLLLGNLLATKREIQLLRAPSQLLLMQASPLLLRPPSQLLGCLALSRDVHPSPLRPARRRTLRFYHQIVSHCCCCCHPANRSPANRSCPMSGLPASAAWQPRNGGCSEARANGPTGLRT